MRGFVFCAFVFLVSCGGANRERHIQLLDSLKTEIKKLEAGLETLQKDSVRMAEITNESTQQLVVFPKVYQPDSVDVDVLLMIQAYKPFSLVAPRYNIRYQRLKTEIPYTLKQLESLLTDLHNKALKRADADKYVNTEKKAAFQLLAGYNALQLEAQNTFRKYDSISQPVHALIDSLKSDSVNIQTIRLKMLKQKTKKRK